ncbi:hypothetical protein MRX96_041592 [Rhipicephalus microplus]
MRPPEKRPPDQTAAPSQQFYKKALLTNASAKVAQAPHGDAENLGAKNIHTGTSGDPNTSKRKTFQQLHILMHEYRDDPDLLLTELEHQFNPIGPPPQYPDYPYVGEENELLDADITPGENRRPGKLTIYGSSKHLAGGKLTARQACSIESASRHNGDFTVHLLHTGRHLRSCAYRRILSKLPNFFIGTAKAAHRTRRHSIVAAVFKSPSTT